jgi:beta-glucosidase
VEHLSQLDRLVKIIDAGADQLGGEALTDLLRQAVEQGLIGLPRLDESVRRRLIVKFQLRLFDDPFVDEDVAEETLGRADFRRAGHRAQAESMVLLRNEPVDGAAALPLRPGLKVYVEGLPAEDAQRLGEIVEDPAAADLAVIRLSAPFDIRDDLFLEGFFHQGSLDYRPGLVARLREIAAATPLVIVANLERPAILTPFVDFASAILTEVGASSAACVDILTGAITPRGRLPFEIPRSTGAIRDSQSDVANDTADPLYPSGAGLSYAQA